MQLADRSSIDHSASAGGHPPCSTSNQQVYLRLKQALRLTLRRQIFLAVCDDLALRNRLAAQLYAELAYPAQTATDSGRSSWTENRSSVATDGIRADTLIIRQSPAVAYPHLVSLNLNLGDPNPMVQTAHWLAQYPPPRTIRHQCPPPNFQILGIERLTRQPATVQRQFLYALQQIEDYLPDLESALLLWLPRPWLHAIQQSAPTFWNWRTALFEFAGDPTPVPISTFHTETAPSPRSPQVVQPTPSSPLHRTAPTVTPERLAAAPVPTEALPTDRDKPPAPTVQPSHEVNQPQAEPARLTPPSEPQNNTRAQPDRPPTAPSSSPQPGTSPPFYPLHTVKDLAELVLAVAWQSQTDTPAVAHTALLETLEEIEQLQMEDATDALAAAYQRLGDLYRDRIEQGDDADETLMIAICAYEQVLSWLDDPSPVWSDVLNEIGNLYWILAHRAPDGDQAKFHLERAIAAYQWGLTHTSPTNCPQQYAMMQNNLGSAYGDLARYHAPVDNLVKSVQAYTEALRHRHPQADSARYAATQNNLGTAYWNLAQHYQPIRCLQRAIAAYSAALTYYTPDREPMYYAMLQNNLGTAYWNLAQHKQSAPDEVDSAPERHPGQGKGELNRPSGGQACPTPAATSPADWLQRAIAAYHAALQFRTLTATPAAHAATQNNLGTAHWHLANLAGISATTRRQHLQQAIAAYHAAISAIHPLLTSEQPLALTFDPAATHNNLGLACQQFASDKMSQTDGTNRHAYLELALKHHLQALNSWQNHPDFYQTALNYLVQTIRTIYQEFGLDGQNSALGKLPPSLLPEVMKRL